MEVELGGGALPLVCSKESTCEKGARRTSGVLAVYLEALEEAAGPDSERKGDADVAAHVATTPTCDHRWLLLFSSGTQDHVIRHNRYLEQEYWQQR